MGWDGMGWDGMGWDGMGWDGMGWDGMGWDGMGWDGMGWDGWDEQRARKIVVGDESRSLFGPHLEIELWEPCAAAILALWHANKVDEESELPPPIGQLVLQIAHLRAIQRTPRVREGVQQVEGCESGVGERVACG
jgi:hypothetical protein